MASNSVKPSKGREDWMYLPVTELQKSQLQSLGYTDTSGIDRGAASFIIDSNEQYDEEDDDIMILGFEKGSEEERGFRD